MLSSIGQEAKASGRNHQEEAARRLQEKKTSFLLAGGEANDKRAEATQDLPSNACKGVDGARSVLSLLPVSTASRMTTPCIIRRPVCVLSARGAINLKRLLPSPLD